MSDYKKYKASNDASRKRYRKLHPEKEALWKRKSDYRRRHGIELEQYNVLCMEQDYKCYLCGVKPKKLLIDHCHKTGKRRKLLCQKCNVRLAVFDDDEQFNKICAYVGRKVAST